MIAERLPDKEFYAYTKMVRMVKSVELPPNFTVIFSYGGDEDHLIDQHNDRHAIVFEDVFTLLNAGYKNCSENDDDALGPEKRIGLVYHGQRNFENTGFAS
jgi:hypothetical protein